MLFPVKLVNRFIVKPLIVSAHVEIANTNRNSAILCYNYAIIQTLSEIFF